MKSEKLNEFVVGAVWDVVIAGFAVFAYFFYDDPTKLLDGMGLETLSWTAKLWVARLLFSALFGGAVFLFFRNLRALVRARQAGQ